MRSIIYIFLACSIPFVQSCQYSKADKGKLDNWLKESKMISHSKLLTFSYKKADIENVELGKINKEIIGDTLVANFYF